MADQWHLNWLREGSKRWNARRKEVGFMPDFSEAKLDDYLPLSNEMQKSQFKEYDFSDADFSNAKISELNFEGARFTRAMFHGSDASNSNFSKAKFYSAKLGNGNFQNAKFNNCRLRSANFTDANYLGASFKDANMTEAIGIDIDKLDDEESRKQFHKQMIEDKEIIETSGPVLIGGMVAYANYKAKPKKGQNIYRVYFATNRLFVGKNDIISPEDYTGNEVDDISYGSASVIIPQAHKLGSEGSPWWKRIFSDNDRLSVSEIVTLNRILFFDLIKQAFNGRSRNTNPTYFIHGYNTSFREALIRAGQIGFDLGLNQGIGLFSWPSLGSTKEYVADVRNMEASKYALANFIEKLVESQDGKKINFIAHSMGCRLLAYAFEQLSNKNSNALNAIDKVILAAADIDQKIMEKMGESITSHAHMTTSYICSKDLALKTSGSVHKAPRVGFYPPVFILDEMDTIKTNDSELKSFGHGYVAENRDIISDMFHILIHGMQPADRFSVEPINASSGKHWRLKK